MIAAQRQVKTVRVDGRANHELGEALNAAFAWWREAGVDCDFADIPTHWLAAPEDAESIAGQPAALPSALPTGPSASAIAARANQRAAAAPAFIPENLPTDLPGFTDWWLAEPLLDGGRSGGRVAPRGPVGADLMVLVPYPEEADDSARLLSGPHGRLLDAMLAAMAIAPDAAYVASVLPRHTPHADWAALHTQGFAAVVSRHVALVAPRRLIAFGGTILPLLGHDPAQKTDSLFLFNHEEGTIPLLTERGFDGLLQKAAWKARFWKRWLDWMD